jgi:hypothetical protein
VIRSRGGQEAKGRSALADYAVSVSLPSVPVVSLGSSGIQVSRLPLGSWRTYERISRDQGIRVMQAAREAGINFLDDARYNDETGDAPMPTGYSEVVFGASSADRPDVLVLGADIALPKFWQDVCDGREITVDMQHGQTVVNSSGAYQQINRTGAAVLSLLGELVLRVIHPAPAVLGNRRNAAQGIELAG